MGREDPSQQSEPTDEPGEILQPLPRGEGFRFACHQGVRCFTDCCRDLHLVLTPYDVLRVRNALAMDSTTFLEGYTVQEMDPTWKVPVVRLKMEENALRSCPFVTQEGCRIYADRPGACRAYPLGRAARQSPSRSRASSVEEEYFLVREPHCFGFEEGVEWTPEAWMEDQGLVVYNQMNDLWMAFLSRYKPGSRQDLSPPQWKMFFMACYSLDRFREFVFGTRFLSLFSIPEERQERLRESDEALLAFAYEWLAYSLFKDPVLELRETQGQGSGVRDGQMKG
jgi:Fe-S-cluster containining protein